MRISKKILLSAAAIIGLIFANGCYYVFWGQEKSADKLKRGQELNLYECCSIYSMHMGVWVFGWVISPEAAEQAFLMQFTKEEKTLTRHNDFFKFSSVFQQQTQECYNKPYFTKQIHYSPADFAIGCEEIRYALAIDGAAYTLQWIDDDENTYPVEKCAVLATYKPYIGIFNIGPLKIIINYRLLVYLQEIGWLHTFTITYEC